MKYLSKLLKKKIENFDTNKYRGIAEFLKVIDDFSIIPDKNLETIEIGIFDRKVIRATRLNDKLCLTLLQTANYIDVTKKIMENAFYNHKGSLSENLDYFKYPKKKGTLYFPLRGILKLLKWTHSGFANRFYDAIVDYICDTFSPVLKSRYEQTRMKALKRDKYTCQRCGNVGSEMHHKFSQTFSPHLKYDLENVEILCYDCHEAITKDSKKRFENS